MKKLLPILLILSVIWSCDDDDSNSTPSAGNPSSQQDVNQYLNDNIILPPGSFKVSSDSITLDPSIINLSNKSGGDTKIEGGDKMTNSIEYSSAKTTVTHAGIRFGDSGPINIIPIDDVSGDSTGTLNFEIQYPTSMCDHISSFCHGVKSYGFVVAETESGEFKISEANINELVAFCGACESQSCQDLLSDPCDTASSGNGRSASLTVDGVPKTIKAIGCAASGNTYFTVINDEKFNVGDFSFIVEVPSIPTQSKTYNIVQVIVDNSLDNEIKLVYEQNMPFNRYGSSVDLGGQVQVNVNGSQIKYTFNNIQLRDNASNHMIVSGEIICN